MNYLRKADETIIKIQDMMKDHDVTPGMEPILDEILYHVLIMRTKVSVWMEHGEKLFVLSNDLLEAFKHTDIPWSLCSNNFHYPFNTFMIEAQDSLFETNFTGYTPRKVRSILFIDNKILLDDPEVNWVGANGVEQKNPDWDVALTGLFTNQEGDMESLMMHLKKDQTLEESSHIRKPGAMILPMEEQDTRSMANIFFNTVLYINDPSRVVSDTEICKKRSVKNAKDGKFHDQKYILLCPPKSYVSLGMSGRKIDKRFIVRGHWWPKLSNTESQKPRRFVVPFWKGPELSEVLSKPYHL